MCARKQGFLCDRAAATMGGTLLDGTTRITHRGRPVFQFPSSGTFAEVAIVPAIAAVKLPADVPLVSPYTASAGVTWNIWQDYLVLDATVRTWGARYRDNDQANTQRRIPADATVDLKLSGQVDHFFWSVAVNNVLDALYYDYAIASSFTPGRFAAYPLPGRNYMVRVGATF